MLMYHDDFDAMMSKCVDPNTLRNIQDKLDTLRKKVCCWFVIRVLEIDVIIIPVAFAMSSMLYF